MNTTRYDSVWDALELAPQTSAHMRLRAEVMIELQESLRAQSGTQRAKAEALGISQPRLNDLLQGRIDKFSLDALVDLVQVQGGSVELRIRPAVRPRASVHEPKARYAARPRTKRKRSPAK